MIRLAVAVAALTLTGSTAPEVSLPPSYVTMRAELAPRCGLDRAEAIATMLYAKELHDVWAQSVANDPVLAHYDGGVEWHRAWSAEYVATVALLEQDCAAPGAGGAR